MPITSTQPIEKDGKMYPYLTVNLSISPLVQDTIGASVAMRLTPYREKDVTEGGGFEMLPDDAKAVAYLDVFPVIEGGDLVLGQTVNGIMTSLQDYITGKGL
jgi:hypothetical protein